MKSETFRKSETTRDVRASNIIAASAVANAVRSSLGPRGMDKMIVGDRNQVTVTNDGATILKTLKLVHPAAKMMAELSSAQDSEAGDGTTSVVVIAGALLQACEKLLSKGVHPAVIAEAYELAAGECERLLIQHCAVELDIQDKSSLVKAAKTSLSSKVVASESDVLPTLAVDAVIIAATDSNGVIGHDADINNQIKVVEKVGGTIDDAKLVDGLVFKSAMAAGPLRVENAQIGLIQFHLSAPKTDVENTLVVSEYAAMDRIIREERKHILKLVKKIKAAGCNVLLVQKSILRDATNDLSLHFLNKMGIATITDVERSDIEFIAGSLGCKPVAHVDSFTSDRLGSAKLVQQVDDTFVEMTGTPNPGQTVTLLVRGSNELVLAEASRSLHDALCVVRCMVRKRYLVPGGGAPEACLSFYLKKFAEESNADERLSRGAISFCVKAFAEALEVVPYTLAENAGLHPIQIVTSLRAAHAKGRNTFGVDVVKASVGDMVSTNVLQPLLVTVSAIKLATETVRLMLKIDSIVGTA